MHQRAPRGGVKPAHVRDQRVDVWPGEEAFVGGHLYGLPAEAPPAPRVLGDARDLPLRDPPAELRVVVDQLVEVASPEGRDVALEGAGVRHAARAERAMAAEAVELDRQLRPVRGQLLAGENLA